PRRSRYSQKDPSQCCSRKLVVSSFLSIRETREFDFVGMFKYSICNRHYRAERALATRQSTIPEPRSSCSAALALSSSTGKRKFIAKEQASAPIRPTVVGAPGITKDPVYAAYPT